MAVRDKLGDARWMLERQLQWIAQAEVKIGVVITVLIAMFAGLGAAYSGNGANKTAWALGSTAAFILLAVAALVCAAIALTPKMKGPAKSLLFFGKVAALSEPDFIHRFKTATEEEHLDDTLAQAHRNAQIAMSKHSWVSKAVMVAFMAAIPWVSAVVILLK